MPDRVQRLGEAAQARHQATVRRAEQALQRLARRGDAVTFRRVAEAAGVSRSWLYSQPELRQQVDQLRESTPTKAMETSAERATVASLRQQIHAYREEITRLRTENQALHEQLARHLGTARAAAVTNRS